MKPSMDRRNLICPYCNQPIKDNEAKCWDGDAYYHISCAAEEADGFDLDNQMGD